MPIDTSLIVPIGNNLKIPEGQDPFRALFSGVASGYQAGQQWRERHDENKAFKEDFKDAYGRNPDKQERNANLERSGIPQGNMLTDFTQGLLGARAINKATADPLFSERQADAREDIRTKRFSNNLNDQLARDSGDLIKEFGEIEGDENETATEKRLKFIQRNAGKALTPQGAQLFSQFNQITGELHKIESASLAGQLKIKQTQDMVELVKDYGGKVGDPASLVLARKKRAVEKEILPWADKMGISVNSVNGDWFDANGNLDMIKAIPELANMPTQQRYDPLAKEKLDLRRRGLDQADIRTQLNALGLQLRATTEGYLIENMPVMPAPAANPSIPGTTDSVAPVAPRPVLTPIPRPNTTATTTTAQESMRNLDNSLAAVDRALASVESTPEAFGPLGGIRQALEVASTFIFPGQGAPISAARTTADVAAEDIIRGMKQDSQMSLFEKKQLDRSARITGPANTPDVAKAKLNVIKVGIAGKAIRDAKLLLRPVPLKAQAVIDELGDLTTYTEEELINAVNQGYISQKRGEAEFIGRKKGE